MQSSNSTRETSMDAVTSSAAYSNPSLLQQRMQGASGDAREQIASDFEAIFVSQLLKEMRNTLDEGLFAGEGSDTYGGLFDFYMSQHLTQGGGSGIGQAILGYMNQSDSTKVIPQA